MMKRLVLCMLMLSAPAQAADKGECRDAYVEGQRLRQQGKLTLARDELVVCAQDACPKVVRADCATWLAEVEASIPSVVVSAIGLDGTDSIDVRVLADGELLRERLDGRQIPLDPGPRLLRFELEGAPAIERRVVLREGDKSRSIEVSFERPAPPPPKRQEKQRPPRKHEERIVPWPLVGVAGGLALAGVAVFVGLGVTAKNEYQELDERCGPNAASPSARGTCSPDEVDDVHMKLVLADVSLGVALGFFAVGAGLTIFNLTSQTQETGWRLQVGPGGARVSF